MYNLGRYGWYDSVGFATMAIAAAFGMGIVGEQRPTKTPAAAFRTSCAEWGLVAPNSVAGEGLVTNTATVELDREQAKPSMQVDLLQIHPGLGYNRRNAVDSARWPEAQLIVLDLPMEGLLQSKVQQHSGGPQNRAKPAQQHSLGYCDAPRFCFQKLAWKVSPGVVQQKLPLRSLDSACHLWPDLRDCLHHLCLLCRAILHPHPRWNAPS
ncbi:MAG: hypothetical protein J3Q66DRAFT_331854 [Benniella sp.]|nr:MAG: hypothetical protein J3Q66DRAFT_331854 [Benniella sp.]